MAYDTSLLLSASFETLSQSTPYLLSSWVAIKQYRRILQTQTFADLLKEND